MERSVYVLLLINGQYYIGSSNDFQRRLEDHLHWNTATTKRIQVEKLLYVRIYSTKQKARKVEMFLKKQKSRKIIEKFMSNTREDMAL